VRGEILKHWLALQDSGWHRGQRSLIMLVVECPPDDERSDE
jgi:hypothetical protein